MKFHLKQDLVLDRGDISNRTDLDHDQHDEKSATGPTLDSELEDDVGDKDNESQNVAQSHSQNVENMDYDSDPF